MSRSRILFILSGSIAAFKACQVISRLVQDGHEVQTVATPGALKFIGAATLEGLTGKPVLSDLWENGRAMDHIHLSRWADFGVLCPASANTVAKFASGQGDDLVSALFLAWPKGKTFHIFPAMNVEMLSNPATQENLSTLAARGFVVHGTSAGSLACGEEGNGRLLEPEKILELLRVPSKGRVLITSGATRESIDGIRFLSNVSTGQTGAELADRLSARGWDVTYVHGTGARLPSGRAERVPYSDFASLDQTLRAQLASFEFDGVIHAAAVSDYSVGQVNGAAPERAGKLSSEGELTLSLKRNHKILPLLKEYSKNKNVAIIGFKLTLNQEEARTVDIARALIGANVDAVVANDWSKVDRDRSRHPGRLVSADANAAGGDQPFADLSELAELLDSRISAMKENNHGSMS
jgi:phosphopantothenoylcysteine decarboxylase / phosphopantothenate---cysteine ligase